MTKRPAEEESDSERNEPQQKKQRAEGAFPYRLRSREVPDNHTSRTQPRFRNTELFVYTSSLGKKATFERRGMSKNVTRDLAARAPFDRLSSTDERRLQLLERRTPANPFGRGESALKNQGLSRNHILADSRIRVAFDEIVKKLEAQSTTPEAEAAIKDFFVALAGKDEGEIINNQFREAINSKNQRMQKKAIYAAANGRENLRIGDAATNTVISNHFDPIIIDGRDSVRTRKIRDAFIELGRVRLISTQSVLDGLAVVKDRATHQDVTSTVIESLAINERTSTRTRIDRFALPKDESNQPRSRTIEEGTSAPKIKLRETAQEVHNLSR